MARRIITYLFIITLIISLSLSGNARATTAEAPEKSQGLVLVNAPSPEALERFAATGLPLATYLHGKRGYDLLVLAVPAEQQQLAAAGLAFQVLDADSAGNSYYLAYPAPGRAAPEWGSFGKVLLAGEGVTLLRMSSAEAERLSLAGAELRQLTFNLKPLPAFPTQVEASPQQVDPDPLVQAMIDQVDSDKVSEYDRQLAGELPVWVDGAWYTIPSRYTYSGVPIEKTTHYVYQFMEALGLDMEYHQWGGPTYPNVIGEIPGLINPDDIYIIGGHLDDVSGTPGADDNASGSVATLIAAEILSQFQWGCTLRFALWTGEEQGLNGSAAYAQRSFNNGENIVGYVNLDMIAWNTIGSNPDISLHADSGIPPTMVLAQLFADVVDAYDLNLIPTIVPNGTGASDHASFWQYGYTAILGIEDTEFGDFNPYYHGSGDTPAHTDLGYFTRFVKAAIATFVHDSECLIPSGIGYLDGTISEVGSGTPLEGATVTAENSAGYTYPAYTDASGYYTRTLLADTYTVTASAYSYLPETVTGVPIIKDTTTTLNFELTLAPTYTVSGTVTELGSGIPLTAEITFEGSPVSVLTDPTTGFYQANLPQGTYTMYVTADQHRPQERQVVVDQDQTQDFALETLPCILLVDDDNDAPNTRPYFTAALDTLGYDYDVFDVGGGGANGPDLQGLAGYSMVIWFSGDKYGGSAGPNSTDETNLTAYLDGGGRLFLSSQDYLYDFDLTPFGMNYLGIGSYTDDNGNATSKIGVAGDPIGDGLGPYTLSYPAGFDDYGDRVSAGNGGSQAFRNQSGVNLDVDKGGTDWKTVFFGTDWSPIYNANAANGEEVLERIVTWFGGCQCDPVTGLDFTWSPFMLAIDQEVDFSAWVVSGTLPIDYAWDFGDETGGVGQTTSHAYSDPGDYPVVLTASNFCSMEVVTHTVSVVVPQIIVDPLLITQTVIVGEQSTASLMIENSGGYSLSFAISTSELVPWLGIEPPEGEVAPSPSAQVTLTLDASELDAGVYTATLLVESNDPFQPSISVPLTLTVTPACVPISGLDFTWSPLMPAIDQEVGFSAAFAAGTPPVTFAWDFGDGVTSTETSPSHEYAEAGEYAITLTASGICNTDEVTTTVTVSDELPFVWFPIVQKDVSAGDR